MKFEFTVVPKRPYANYSIYLDKIRKANRYARLFPCFECEGRGKVRNPAERDDYEGYKLAGWYPCTACGASGEAGEFIYKAKYQQLISEWKEAHRQASLEKHEQLAIAKRVKEAFNSNELKTLKYIMRRPW